MQNSTRQKMFKGIGRWKQSGLTQKAWCEKNNVAYATFHYWYKRYRISESPVVDQDTDGGFVQVMVNDSVNTGYWCELVLPTGRKLAFQQPVSAEFLRILIS